MLNINIILNQLWINNKREDRVPVRRMEENNSENVKACEEGTLLATLSRVKKEDCPLKDFLPLSSLDLTLFLSLFLKVAR